MFRLLRAARASVMPQRCAFCGALVGETSGAICGECKDDLVRAAPAHTLAPLSRIIAPLAYDFPIDVAIKALKFRRKLFYGVALGRLLCDARNDLPDDIDALQPVPLHWRRQWFRGFNQAREIAAPLAKELGVPVVDAVTRRLATRSQSGLSAAERARNVRAAFVARGRLRFRHVLIVDDVITTGATVRRLARTLLQAGVVEVSALAVARAQPDS